jgi:hypothetical protein
LYPFWSQQIEHLLEVVESQQVRVKLDKNLNQLEPEVELTGDYFKAQELLE